jgi:hypothetical protein
VLLLTVVLTDVSQAQTAPVVGRNVNMVGGIGRKLIPNSNPRAYSYALGDGDPFLTKQNEPSISVSSVNPQHLLAAANDYRLIPLAQALPVLGEGNSAAADAWIGVFRSADGGKTWRSTVLAGCPVAIPQCAGNTALSGTTFASDPTVSAGPYGTHFISFIAGNRGTSSAGVVGIQRFFDRNNNVTADDNPFSADVLNIVDTGSTGQFVDKSFNIADVPRPWNAGATCTLPTSPTPVHAFNVYVSYANFTGQDPLNSHPQAEVAVSTNCGATFAKPVKVSASVPTNQGTTMAIDPNNGAVYLFWRQIFTTANNTPDAIYYVKSTDGGNTWTKPAVVALINPFDQNTTGATFRTEVYPTAAVDGSGRVYVAWSQRGVGPSPGATQGAARIVITTSNNGATTWTTPTPVDNNFQNQIVPYANGANAPNPPPSWASFNQYNAAGYGHQFQPALSFAAGKLTMIWADNRLSHTAGRIDCSLAPTPHNISQCTEVRDQRPSAGTDPISKVFTDLISDAGLTYRQTMDVFGGQATPADNPVFAVTRVSQYPFGNDTVGARTAKPIRQLQVNPPNLPLFSKGTQPFMGDYLGIAAQAIIPTGAGTYAWNTSSTNAAVWHAAWADNRDVIPPADGISWQNYQPILTLASDGVTLVTNPSCLPGYAGSQNQNIYTAPIFGGINAYAVVNSKQLSSTSTSPRQFNVVVENGSTRTASVSLTILNQPVGGYASFEPVPPGSLVTTVPSLNIFPSSSLTRAVWVTSSNPAATVTVNVNDANGNLITSVLLNPDSNATTATAAPAPVGGDIVSVNQSDVTVVNTPLSNYELGNFELGNFELGNYELGNNSINNYELGNYELGNYELGNYDVGNTDLGSYELGNYELGNYELGNYELGNTSVASNTPTNYELGNAGIADTSFVLFNNSATTDVTLDTKTLLRGGTIPPGYKAQLFVHKIYYTQTTNGTMSCSYAKVPQRIAVVNAPGPTVTQTTDLSDPNVVRNSWVPNPDPSNATISLLPGEVGRVTYRLIANPGTDPAQNQNGATELGSNGVKTVSINQSSTSIPIPIVIDTLSLPDATAGANYSTTVQSIGGLAPATWSLPGKGPGTICPAGSNSGIPAGTSLTSAGLLSGMPTTPGVYCFVVEVADSSTPTQQTDQQTLTLVVHGTQSVSFPAGPLAYGSTTTLPAATSAGLAITYSVSSGTCSVAGNILTAKAGSGSCILSATNSGNQVYLALNASQSYTMSPATLTVTANNLSMTYGGTVPTLTASYSGFVNGDTAASVLTGGPALSTGGTSTSPVGPYAITVAVGTLSAKNYTFAFVKGVLTVMGYTFTPTALKSPAQLGSSVPVNWTLQDASGAYITALSTVTEVDSIFNGPTSGSCSTTVVLYTPATGAKGNSNLRNVGSGFQFNWDTTVNATNCGKGTYTVKISLTDGSAHTTSAVQLK